MSAMMNEARLRYEIEQTKVLLAAIQRERSAAEADEMRAIQQRANKVSVLFGERVSEPRLDENPVQYRRRLAEKLAAHSSAFKGESLAGLGPAALTQAENRIYGDAQDKAMNTRRETPGLLIKRTETDEAGRTVTFWDGDPGQWMQHFQSGAQIGFIRRPPGVAR